MRTGTLATVAVLLGVLLTAVIWVGLDRLGYRESAEAPDFVFENVILKVPPGTWVIMRPMQDGVGEVRLLFAQPVVEPEIVRNRKPDPTRDPPQIPYMHMVSQRRRANESFWTRGGDNAALLATMGARGASEWLEEIRPVRERLPDGSHKTMLRALFRSPSGASNAYFYDPADPHPERRGYGWVRVETYGGDSKLSEVLFAIPDGRAEPVAIESER